MQRVGAGSTRALITGEAVVDIDRACWAPLAPIIVAIVVVHAKPAAHTIVTVYKAARTLYACGGGASAVPIAGFVARLARIDAPNLSAESSIGAGCTVRG